VPRLKRLDDVTSRRNIRSLRKEHSGNFPNTPSASKNTQRRTKKKAAPAGVLLASVEQQVLNSCIESEIGGEAQGVTDDAYPSSEGLFGQPLIDREDDKGDKDIAVTVTPCIEVEFVDVVGQLPIPTIHSQEDVRKPIPPTVSSESTIDTGNSSPALPSLTEAPMESTGSQAAFDERRVRCPIGANEPQTPHEEARTHETQQVLGGIDEAVITQECSHQTERPLLRAGSENPRCSAGTVETSQGNVPNQAASKGAEDFREYGEDQPPTDVSGWLCTEDSMPDLNLGSEAKADPQSGATKRTGVPEQLHGHGKFPLRGSPSSKINDVT
jgi:hypothetical protein